MQAAARLSAGPAFGPGALQVEPAAGQGSAAVLQEEQAADWPAGLLPEAGLQLAGELRPGQRAPGLLSGAGEQKPAEKRAA